MEILFELGFIKNRIGYELNVLNKNKQESRVPFYYNDKPSQEF